LAVTTRSVFSATSIRSFDTRGKNLNLSTTKFKGGKRWSKSGEDFDRPMGHGHLILASTATNLTPPVTSIQICHKKKGYPNPLPSCKRKQRCGEEPNLPETSPRRSNRTPCNRPWAVPEAGQHRVSEGLETEAAAASPSHLSREVRLDGLRRRSRLLGGRSGNPIIPFLFSPLLLAGRLPWWTRPRAFPEIVAHGF
jgi:hypothetical protein